MKYLPLALLVFSLLFCHYKSLTPLVDKCANYVVKENINECLNQDSENKHFSCCGYKLGNEMNCEMVGKTKASRDIFKKTREIMGTTDIACPEIIDEIKGTCEEFSEVYVDDQNQCYGLTPKDDKETSCCGLKIDAINPFGTTGTMTEIQCYELSKDENKRKEEIEQIMKSKEIPCDKMEHDCKCYDNYLMINFIIFGFIMLLF